MATMMGAIGARQRPAGHLHPGLALAVAMLAAPVMARDAPPTPVDVLVRDVTIIDVVDGARHVHRDLAARDGRIVAITESGAEPARTARRISSAHIPMAVPVAQASAAGLDSIEHIAYAYKAGSPEDAALSRRFAAGELDARGVAERVAASFDPAAAGVAYRALARNGTAVTPTLNGSFITAYLDQDDHAADAYLQYIGPGLQATYAWRVERAAQDDAAAVARRHQRFEAQAAVLPLLQESGVTILAGTDAGFLNSFNYPGIALHQEMELFVRYGLTPLQALQAATINGARFMRRDRSHGSLAEGKAADLVLLDADPLSDIGAIRRIDTVILRGQVHDRKALDAMLEDVRSRVARMTESRGARPREAGAGVEKGR
jgi:hypothetical protein